MSAHPWVCSSCRSVNQPRENRCYSCRTPRELVEADPETLLVAGAGSRPSAGTAPVAPVAPYRSSGDRAFLTQVLIAVSLGVTLVGSVMGADLVGRVIDGTVSDAETPAITVAVVGGFGLLLSVAARVVGGVAAAGRGERAGGGLGWPNVTPNAAVFESLIPGVNLYRVPAILRDVTSRLEPEGRGDGLIAAAWLAIVGGVLVPRIGRAVSGFLVGSIEELTTVWTVVGQLGLGLTIVGGALLITLIQWIETRMDRRASALAPAPSATPAPRA